MLFYIQTVHGNAGIDSVNQQTEQVSDSMDEDGTLVADETLSLRADQLSPQCVCTHSVSDRPRLHGAGCAAARR